MLSKLPLVIKYGLYGGVVVGGVVGTFKLTDSENSAIAVVRLTKTAYAAVDIAMMYKRTLYSKEWDVTSDEYLEAKSCAHKMGAQKLLHLCQSNKGVYIKIGQHIGALDYLLPDEYVKTMRVLHKDAPKNDIKELYRVIREDLKCEPEEVFMDFEPEPLGTASLGQVHRAKLVDGTDVAVKVQHHYVKGNIDVDLLWLDFIINMMSKVFPDFQMRWLVDETKRNIRKELDYVQEGQNAEKISELFKDYKWLKVPKVFWDVSTDRVLVMEYVTGGQINDVNYIEQHGINKGDLCKKITDLYSHMIFLNGFVHADPHPGNILVKQDPGDKEVTVCLLDHGLYAQLTDKFRYHYSKLWLAIIAKDTEDMKLHSMALGVNKELYGLLACIVTARPWETIIKGIGNTKRSSEEKRIFQTNLPNFAPYITQCLEQVDRQALLVFKTNDLIRSIEYTLGMHESMRGFIRMTSYCMKSVCNLEVQNTDSTWKRQYIKLRYTWSLCLLYVLELFSIFKQNISISLKRNVA